MRPDQKEEPRRGECRGSYALHRTHYYPDRTQLGMCSMPSACGSFLTVPCQSPFWQQGFAPFISSSLAIWPSAAAECPLGTARASLVRRRVPCTMIEISAIGPKLVEDSLIMRWRGERESENVEERRDEGGAGGFNFPGGVSFPSGGGSGGGGIGIIGILIILGLMSFFGLDPTVLMQGGGPGGDQGNFPDIHLPQSQPGPDTSDVPEPGTQGPRSSIPRAPAKTTSGSSSAWCSPTPRTSGTTSSASTARNTATRSSCCFPARFAPPAAPAWQRWGRSIVRTTRKFTSISASMTS